RLAKKTEELIEQEIGTYQQLQRALDDENSSERSRNYAALTAIKLVPTQTIRGDADAAVRAFININENPAVIDPVELAIIKIRKKPNAIATRALMRAGTGYKYWSQFSVTRQAEIEAMAREVYDDLFLPVLDSPISTLDLPVAGQAYSADSFRMLFD